MHMDSFLRRILFSFVACVSDFIIFRGNKRHDFLKHKKSPKVKCVLLFSLKHLSELFLILRKVQLPTTTNVHMSSLNPLNPELNPICYLLALLGAHYFLHVSRIRVKLLTFRRLMSYIYGAPILDVSRSHTTTQHSR